MMKRRVALALVAFVIFRPGMVSSGELSGSIKQEIHAADIGANTDILGTLGFPLGEMVTLTATYDPKDHLGHARDGKNGLPVIVVTGVNGSHLPQPIKIVPTMCSGETFGFTAGETFECRGCETGMFENMSEEFIKENEKVGQTFQSGGKFGFYTRFLVVKGPVAATSPLMAAAEKSPDPVAERKQIRAADIGNNAVILGWLGVPIGHVVTMTATMDPARQPKPPEIPATETAEQTIHRLTHEPPYVLRILKIDGKDLTEPVEVNAFHLPWDRRPKYPTNQPFEVRGCENAAILSISDSSVPEYVEAGCGEVAEKGPTRLVTWVQLLNSSTK